MAFLAGYNKRQKIIIDSDAHISGDESNFTSVVHIPSSNSSFWASEDGDGTYVRFTGSDGTTLLKFELESFDTVGDDVWWHVKIPILSSSTDTNIYIYYDADTPSDGSDKENSWDSGYKGVWHLNQDKPEGAFDDSTSSNNDGTNGGTIDGLGSVDRGRSLDDLDDYINMGDKTSLDFGTSDFTVNSVINANVAEVTGIILGKWSGIVSEVGWYFYTVGGKIYLNMSDGTNSGFTASIGDIRGALHTVGARADRSGNMQVFIDGIASGTPVSMAGIGSLSSAFDFVIGAREGKDLNFYGIIDESQVSDTLRSVDYMAARHQSNLGDWISFEAEEILRFNGFPFFFDGGHY